MKAHELARKLLEGPDWEVYAQDGSYLSTWEKVDIVEKDAKLERIYLETE